MRSLVLCCSLVFCCSEFLRSAPPSGLAANYSTLHGKVTDADGAALPNIRVDISTAAPKVGPGVFCPSCYLDCKKWAKTDEQGEFTIDKLDPHLKFRIVAAGPNHRAQQTELIDPSAGPLTIALTKRATNIDDEHSIHGIIKSDLGIPIEGALVEPLGGQTASRRWWGPVDVDSTVSDHEGKFTLDLPTGLNGLDIRVHADGYCSVQSDLVPPGPQLLPIQMDQGATVRGKLVHGGKPVSNMSIAVVQINRGPQDGIFIAAMGDVTRDDGSFEFKCLPPNQQYVLYSVVGDARRTENAYVLTTKKFMAPSSGKTRDLGTHSVTSPIAIRGQVVEVNDSPLPPNTKIIFGRDPAWDLISVPVQADGRFEIKGLPPETYEIGLSDRGLELVADKMRYQILSPTSFGMHVTKSVDDLVISVKGK
jgi:hypothetical protein